MIYIYVPIAVTFMWATSTVLRKTELDLVPIFDAAILSSVTSLLLWSSQRQPSSIIQDRPELAIVFMAILVAGLVGMVWLKIKFPPRA